MLNEGIWKTLTENRTLQEGVPSWMRPVLAMSFREVEALPTAAELKDAPGICKPRLDLAEMKTSYLDFLGGEVRLRPNAADLYQKRLNALIPYEGKELYQLSVYSPKVGICVVMLQVEDLKVIHIEP